MNRGLTRSALFLPVALLFASAAQTMEIQQFDKMADRDQADYIQVLVDGAQKVLRDEGRGDLARKMGQLFTEIPAGDKFSLGMEEFENNLALARVTDAKNVIKDPNAQRLEVEDAMAVTLQKNHIELPDSFFIVASGFKPKSPSPKSPVPDGASTNSDSKLMVTHNPDGTFTVQKVPPNGNSKDTKVTKGLVIPPQVVVPIFSTPEKKQ